MTDAQLIGAVIGGFVGLLAAAAMSGGAWEHTGGGWLELTDAGDGCLPGCLTSLALVALGAGAGYAVGSMF
jgi:hypothetical protein